MIKDMKIKKIYTMLLASIALTACQQENLSDPVKGAFSISLTEATAEVETKATPADLDKPVAEKFNLLITNKTTGKELYKGAFTDQTIPASVGTYTVKATCSPNTSYEENPVLALDAPYYEGTEEATLTVDKTVSVTIPCHVANALASIRFGNNKDKFEALFSSYSVEVKVGNSSVSLQDTLRSAYYRAGSDVKFFFKGKLKGNGQDVTKELTHSEFSKAETFVAGAHCVINLSVEKTTSGVILTVAAAEVKKETINATIPMEWLPAPKILVKGFTGNTLDLYETASPKDVSFDFDLSSSLQELKFAVDFEDQVYKALNGDYTLSTMSDADKAKFVDAGIILPVIGQSSPSINIAELVSKLKADNEQTINNTFSITEVKANNRTISGEYKILTHKPEFSVSVLPGNVWTKEFTAEDCTVTEGKGDATAINADLIYQYSADNGRTWNAFNDNTNARQAFISTPENKIYQVRALYRGELASSAINVELESPIQLPNSDMEEWTSSTRYEQPYYQPWSEHVEHCWDTNNNETMRDKYSTYPNYKTFPTTTYTEDGYKGRAAVIRTVAANNGWASEVMSGTAYRGKLIVGNTDDSGNITEGYSFGSRPTELDFYYKYDSYNNERFGVYVELMNGDDVIASNSYISGRQTVSSYTLASVLLPYDESDLKPATSIRIRCYSVAEGEDPAVRKQTITIPAGSRKIYGGSCLTIDNISLIYDK
ncbi:DUF4493 domain-containing protein [Parabacteroides sp. AF19-14]|jgi:hypothetical protein|nr:DUF4493 domain-containing protein [Parabacteroides sp. AF19-14]